MALSKLSGDEQCIIFCQLCNTLDPGFAVAFSSTNSELWTLTQALRQQLKADHEAAAALCLKLRMRSCKELREAKSIRWLRSCTTMREAKEITAADLGLLGTLGSVLPALEFLALSEPAAGPDGVQQLAVGLGAGALPAVTFLGLDMHVGDAGASALAAALGQGALPRLKSLELANPTAIGDAGLVALAPALRRLPALEELGLYDNPFGDEGLAALVAPPPPTGGLKKLKTLDLSDTQVTDAGCATLAAALKSGALPALEFLLLFYIPASDAAKAAVYEARANLKDGRGTHHFSEVEESEEED